MTVYIVTTHFDREMYVFEDYADAVAFQDAHPADSTLSAEVVFQRATPEVAALLRAAKEEG